MLSQLTLITTYRCDLGCQHCIQGFPRKRQDFPVDLFEKLVIQAMPFGARHVVFTGGEAHLHPQFEQLVEGAVAYGFTWSLITHGLRAQPYLGLMERHREHFRYVGVSIDGASAALHDELRGRQGAFEATCSTVRTYAERGFRVEIKSSLNQKNMGDLAELVRLAQALGAQSMLFAGTIPTAWNQHLVLTDEQSLALHDEIIRLRGDSKIKVRETSAMYTRGGVNFCPILNLSQIAFNPRGEMMFCCDVDHEGGVIGSLQELSVEQLTQVWLRKSADLQAERARSIAAGQMGTLFDTCNYCNRYFDPAHVAG